MKPLTQYELLDIWEKGLHQTMLEKTLSLLAKAYATDDRDQVGHLSIGDRDARLLRLREWTFGSQLNNMTKCPHCHEVLEWQSTTREFYLQPVLPDFSIRTFVLDKDSYHIQFRLPDSFDILKAMCNNNPQTAISDCVLDISSEKGTCSVADLDDKIWEALNERMFVEDPQANININLTCPSCSNKWNAIFDIVSFFWAEINNWARHIMQEVCFLAGAFGWSEKDILTMSPHRRQLYIQMLNK